MGAERTFTVMGTRAQVRVSAASAAVLGPATRRLRALEHAWTRFDPTSDLARVNAAGGRPVPVSSDTLRLARTAMEAWARTGGVVDPRVLDALERAGYDRSHEMLTIDHGPIPAFAGTAAPRPDPLPPLRVAIDVDASTLAWPAEHRWDGGGIGKGLAADMLVEELVGSGVRSVSVDLGGDIRMHGPALGEPCWTVLVDDPFHPGQPVGVVHLTEGAVATSSRAKRRWLVDGRPAHHLIDPSTGRPAMSDVVQATVVAASTWWAEALAKTALIKGSTEGADRIATARCSALIVTDDGSRLTIGDHIRTGQPV